MLVFKRIVLGLCIFAVVAAIRRFRQFIRKRAATAALVERRRVEWMREFEQIRSSSRAPFRSAKAVSAGFRVVK